MPETLAPQPEQAPTIPNEAIDEWLTHSDRFFDETFNIDRGNGAESVEMVDAVWKRHVDEHGQRTGESTPIVILKDSKGETYNVEIRQFLEWRGLDEQLVREEAEVGRLEAYGSTAMQSEVQATSLAPSEDVVSTLESINQPYSEFLFTPIEAGPEKTEPNNYDDLFDASKNLEERSTQDARVDGEKVIPVTEATKQSANSKLAEALQIDAKLKSIIDNFTRETGISDIPNLSDAIRVNKDLRVKIGEHFLDKLSANYMIMPDRIRGNDEKNIRAPGYRRYGDKLPSRDYAALLALSMIDGRFDPKWISDGPVEIDPVSGKVKTGQHRWAAEKILSIN